MRRIYFSLFLLTGLTGCVGNDLLVQRQSSLEGRLEQVMLSENTIKADVATLSAQLQELRLQAARHTETEKNLHARYDDAQEKIRVLANRLTQLESVTRPPKTIELVNESSAPQGHDESVQAAYIKAFGLFSANNYREAAEAFTTFIAAYPESEYAANARFWLGECYFSLERYSEAIDSFSRTLEMNPLPKRAADAMLKIGFAWYRLNNAAKGAATLRLLLEKYPGSEAAEMAANQLDKK